MALVRISEPQAEPLTLDEAKEHLRVDIPDEDALISALIVVARERAEFELNRALISQSWRLTLDSFPGNHHEKEYHLHAWHHNRAPIYVPMPNLQQISLFTYIDAFGDEQTMTENVDYILDSESQPARITPMPQGEWPKTQMHRINAVKIEYSAGYGTADDVPKAIKQGMLLLIGHLYENREAVGQSNLVPLPMAVQYLWQTHRILRFG